MRKRLVNGVLLLSSMWLLFVFGCGDDSKSVDEDDSDPSVVEEGDWLTRKDIPESEFKPPALETAVDAMVEEVNKLPQDEKMKLSFMPKELIGFFEKTIEGANDAFDELGVVNTVVAPPLDIDELEQRAQQIQYVEERIEQGYSGIGIASMDEELIPSLDKAVDDGMTIVTFDSDEPNSKRQFYVGTINTEAGKTGGETMVEVLGSTTGKVIILGNDDEGWTDGYERTHEARKVIEAAGFTTHVWHTDWNDQDANEAGIQALMEDDAEGVVGCIGVFSNAFLCASASEKAGRSDIKNVAFDFEDKTLEYMQSGQIEATHVQRQYYMGYIIPYLLYSSSKLGVEETKDLVSNIMVDSETIDTGLDIVRGDTLDAYYTFLKSLSL